jgi:hypothetical protein
MFTAKNELNFILFSLYSTFFGGNGEDNIVKVVNDASDMTLNINVPRPWTRILFSDRK